MKERIMNMVKLGCVLLVVCTVSISNGQTTRWDGASAEWDATFGEPPDYHWLNDLPSSTVTGRVDTGTPKITQPDANHSAKDLFLGYTVGGNGSVLQTGNGSELTVHRDLVVGYGTGADSSYQISDGTLTVNDDLHIGYGTGAKGIFTQSGNNDPEVIVEGHLYVGDSSATGTKYTLDADDGTLTVESTMTIGNSASDVGTFELKAGTVTVWKTGVITRLYVGGGGTGIFNQTGGNLTVGDNTIYIGYSANSSGTYELTSGTMSAGYLQIGYYGEGVFNQSGGTVTLNNTLTLGNWASSDGTYNLSGGTCSFGNVRLGRYGDTNSKFDMSGGSLTVTLDLYIGVLDGGSGELEISGGTVTAKRLHVGYALDNAGTATLDIQDDSAVIKVGEKLRFGKRSTLVIATGQDPTITMTESDASFEIDADATAANLDLGKLKLVFECADNSDRKKLEVAGAKANNPPPAGAFKSDNFLLKELVVGKDGATGPITLQLVDDEDNQDESDEALYVNTLTIKAGGTFARVHKQSWTVGQPDYDLYYDSSNPKKLWMGDANLDGVVGDSDLSILLSNYGNGSGMTWANGDFNGDGAVNDSDLSLLLAYFGSGEDRGGDFPADLDGDGDIDIDDVRLYLKKKG